MKRNFGMAIATVGLMLVATVSVLAHAPDDAYQAEYDRRLPGGDEHILSAVIEALNKRDVGFFEFFFGPYTADAKTNGAAFASIWKANLSFSELPDTSLLTRDGQGPLVRESVLVDEIDAHRVVGTSRLSITWTDPDGFLNIRSIRLNP